MPARVKIRAVIWIGDRIAVHRTERHGRPHVTLPGGRVTERESITDALRRELREELGIEITVGDLLFAAEVHSGARRQDVELIFAAELAHREDGSSLEMIDPADPGTEVLPPILPFLVTGQNRGPDRRWLGNLYQAGGRNRVP
jgi:ADP-ribose pyrophosphatase YjhB (NUDIX family)